MGAGVVRLLIFLVFLLAPAFALAALPPHITKRIQRVAQESGEIARQDAASLSRVFAGDRRRVKEGAVAAALRLLLDTLGD